MSTLDRAFIRAYEIEAHTGTSHLSDAAERLATVRGHAVHPPSRNSTVDPSSSAIRDAGGPTLEPTVAAGPHFRIFRDATPPSSGESAQRRPLSAFSQRQTVEARFRPSLEVDGFRWPAACEQLLRKHRPRWQTLVQSLLAADDAGRSLIGVGGTMSGVGVTTIVACLARLLVDAGKSVAIVDADFKHAALAKTLGLAIEIGWEDVLAGRVPLAEAIVYSIADRVALLPLVQGGVPAAEKLDSMHASVTAGVLRYHYDMVLFDLGAVTDVVQGPAASRLARQCRLDGCLITTPGADDMAALRLKDESPELAASCLGLIEMDRGSD